MPPGGSPPRRSTVHQDTTYVSKGARERQHQLLVEKRNAELEAVQRAALAKMRADMLEYDKRTMLHGVAAEPARVGSWHVQMSAPYYEQPSPGHPSTTVGHARTGGNPTTLPPSRPTTRGGISRGSMPTAKPFQPAPLFCPTPSDKEVNVMHNLGTVWSNVLRDGSSYNPHAEVAQHGLQVQVDPPAAADRSYLTAADPSTAPHLSAQHPHLAPPSASRKALEVSAAAAVIAATGAVDRPLGAHERHYTTTSLRALAEAPSKARTLPWWADSGASRPSTREGGGGGGSRAASPQRVVRKPVHTAMEQMESMVSMPEPGSRDVQHDKLPGELNYFPLEYFDDGAYEEEGGMTRNVMAAAKAMVMTRGVGGRGFSKWFAADGTFEWRRVTALEKTDTSYLVEWDHSGKQKWVTKLNILFEGDEEAVLAERRHTALDQRREAEAQVLQRLRVEAMPTGEWPIPDALMESILARVGNVSAHSKVPGSNAARAVKRAEPGIIDEIRADFARTMNEIKYNATVAAVVSAMITAGGPGELDDPEYPREDISRSLVPPGVLRMLGTEAAMPGPVAVVGVSDPQNLAAVVATLAPGTEWGGRQWFRDRLATVRELALVANPYMQGALDELRWFVTDLKKLELFKLTETIPTPALRTTQTAVPANLAHKVKVREKHMVQAGHADGVSLEQFRAEQRQLLEEAVDDVVERIHRNAGNIMADAADVEYLETGIAVSRVKYGRLVSLVNTMVRDTMRLCLRRNLEIVRVIFQVYHKKAALLNAASAAADPESSEHGMLLPMHMTRIRKEREHAGTRDRTPSWEALVDRWDAVTASVKAVSSDAGGDDTPAPAARRPAKGAAGLAVLELEEEDEEEERRRAEAAARRRQAHLASKEGDLRRLMEIMPSMFALKPVSEGERIFFDPPLERFPDLLAAEIQNAKTQLSSCKELQVVTPLVNASCVGHSDFAIDLGKAFVLEFQHDDTLVDDLFAEIRYLFDDSVDGPLALLASLQDYAHMLADTGPIFLQQFAEAHPNLHEWADAIEHFKEEEEQMQTNLPSSVNFGLFSVDCSEMKAKLMTGAMNHMDTLMKSIKDEMANIVRKLQKELNSIMKKLCKKASSLTDVFATKDLIVAIPGKLAALGPRLESMEERYELLSRFHFGLSDNLVSTTWAVRMLPSQIEEEMVRREAQLPEEEKEFHRVLMRDREAYAREITKLELEVRKWCNSENFTEEVGKYHKECMALIEQCQTAWDRAEYVNSNERIIDMEESPFKEQVEMLQQSMSPYRDLWQTVFDWTNMFPVWMYQPIVDIDLEAIERLVPAWMQSLSSVQKVVAPACAEKAAESYDAIASYWANLPVVRCLRTPGLRDRHWHKICEVCAIPRELDRYRVTLDQLLNIGIEEQMRLLVELTTIAAKEAVLEKMIDKISDTWSNLELDLSPWQGTGALVLRRTDDIMGALDDSMLKLQTLSLSAYVRPHMERVESWTRYLNAIHTLLHLWLDTQSKWVYLAPLFSSALILNHMQAEGHTFQEVDAMWRDLTEEVSRNPLVIDVAMRPHVLYRLKEQLRLLDHIQKGLNVFLDFKRGLFPRMAFLSNDELLGVLVSCQKPRQIQPHLIKVFSGIDSLLVVSQNELMPVALRVGEATGAQDSSGQDAVFTHSLSAKAVTDALTTGRSRIKNSGPAAGAREEEAAPSSSPRERGKERTTAEVYGKLVASLHSRFSSEPAKKDPKDKSKGFMYKRKAKATSTASESDSRPTSSQGRREDSGRMGSGRSGRIDSGHSGPLGTEEGGSSVSRLSSAARSRFAELTPRSASGAPGDSAKAGLPEAPPQDAATFTTKHLITNLISREGEVLPLQPPIPLRSKESFEEYRQVEDWMKELEGAMRFGVSEQMLLCLDSFEKLPRRTWLLEFPSQAVLTVQRLLWTRLVHQAVLRAETAATEKSRRASDMAVARGASGADAAKAGAVVLAAAAVPEGAVALKQAAKALQAQLSLLVVMITDQERKLTALQRTLVSSMVMQEVQGRDAVQRMLASELKNLSDFDWLREVRIYIDVDGNILIRNMNTTSAYAYEYIGAAPRLVVTPLTERCFVTCIAAMHFMQGGAPEGPAGTGKTETVKELAKVFGRFCLVFNCSEGVDVLTMARFFQGLMQVGAWSCFDEFNRIQLDVLSVIAQQILTINTAIASQRKTEDGDVLGASGNLVRVVFEGTRVQAQQGFATFITLNPTEYAGRVELPDNLRALFRPVAMLVPDYHLIAEVSLFSSGFRSASILGNKIVACLRLAAGQLSNQDHYDWSMRNMKTLLGTAQRMREAVGEAHTSRETEEYICLRALTKSNVPKLTTEDLTLFRNILADLFPGQPTARTDHDRLVATLQEVCPTLKLQPLPHFIKRCLQIMDTLEVRHGIMLLGKSGTGKTSCLRALQTALDVLAERGEALKPELTEAEVGVRLRNINPKALSLERLYGYVDMTSRDWTDGVFAVAMREAAAQSVVSLQRHWIVFDGPVDTFWVENLNTLLDDSMKLCLSSGETILMPKGMQILFELDDLRHASTASVTRCGMVFLDSSDVDWEILIAKWFSLLPPLLIPYKYKFANMFELLVNPLADFVQHDCRLHVRVSPAHALSDFLRLLDCHLNDSQERLALYNEQNPSGMHMLLEVVVLVSLVYSMGNLVATVDRYKFGQMFHELCHEAVEKSKALSQQQQSEHSLSRKQNIVLLKPIPQDDDGKTTVYDYFFNMVEEEWQSWKTVWSQYQLPVELGFHEMNIPSPDTCARSYLFDILIRNKHHILLMGETATGKTVSVQDYIRQQMALLDERALLQEDKDDPESTEVGNVSAVLPVKMSLSAEMGIKDVQLLLENNLTRKMPGLYGPEAGTMVVFVDDVHHAAQDEFGTQPGLELLRQWLELGGWYFTGQTAWSTVQGMQMVAALTLSGSETHRRGVSSGDPTPVGVPQRYLRHHHLILTTVFTDAGIRRVFSVMIDDMVANAQTRHMLDDLLDCTINLFHSVKRRLLPVPSRPHYIFNMRHISRIFESMLSKPAIQRQANAPSDVVRLWVHESSRVLSDGILDEPTAKWFRVRVLDLVMTLPAHKVPSKEEARLLFDTNYCSFVVPMIVWHREGRDGDYERQPYNKINEALVDHLAEHNHMFRKNPMNIVLFRMATVHTTHMVRILDRDFSGHALHLGQAGCGRRTLTTLASFIARCKVYPVEMRPEYTRARWREELKDVLHQAGTLGKRATLLVVDSPLFPEVILDNLEHLVKNGEVPGLYLGEDRNMMLEQLAPGLAVEPTSADEDATSPTRPHAYSPGRRSPDEGSSPERGDHTDRPGAESRESSPGRPNPEKDTLNPQKLEDLFLQRCRQNLRVVLCCAATEDGGLLARRLRKFPAFAYNMTAVILHGWDQEACEAVARVQWSKCDVPQKVAETAERACAAMHHIARQTVAAEVRRTGFHTVITSADFVELLGSVTRLLVQKRTAITEIANKYAKGVKEMDDLQTKVEEIKATLERLRPILEKTQAETNALVTELEVKEADANATQVALEKEKQEASEEMVEARQMRDMCDLELAATMPGLHEAIAQMRHIHKRDIAELKSMHHPPDGVRRVMECVVILLGRHPPNLPRKKITEEEVSHLYWAEAQRTMGDFGFLQELIMFDRESIDDNMISVISKYTAIPEFNPGFIAQVSRPAMYICRWVLALAKHYDVMKMVRPRQKALQIAEHELKVKLKALKEKKTKMREILRQVAELRASHAKLLKRKHSLEDESATQARRVQRAQQLLGALHDERTRWAELAVEKSKEAEDLLGDSLLAGGLVAYMGALEYDTRLALFEQWRTAIRGLQTASGQPAGVVCSDNLRLDQILFTRMQVERWHECGLPHSAVAVENAAIVTLSKRWPLIVDPQDQGNMWVRRMWRGEVATTTSKSIVVLKTLDAFTAENAVQTQNTLFKAIEHGKVVLLEGVEEVVDPLVEALLAQKMFTHLGQLCIQVGEHSVEYNSQFILFLTSRLPNPKFPSELLAKAVLLNWIVTLPEVAERLLSLTAMWERPELERERRELHLRRIRDDYELQEVERRVLGVIASSEGDLLEDEGVLNTLGNAHRTAADIKRRLAQGQRNERVIEEVRQVYHDRICARLSQMFQCLMELEHLDHTYHFSLQLFVGTYKRTLEVREDDTSSASFNSLEDRVRIINAHFVKALYFNVSPCLWDRHKILLAISMYLRLMYVDRKISLGEMVAFMTGKLDALGMTDPADPSVLHSGTLATAIARMVGTATSAPRVSEHASQGSLSALDPRKSTYPAPFWLSDTLWSIICKLDLCPRFKGIAKACSLSKAKQDWRRFVEEPSIGTHPSEWTLNEGVELCSFHYLLLYKAFKVDDAKGIQLRMQGVIIECLDFDCYNAPSLDLSVAVKISDCKTPCIFILTPGNDPVPKLKEYGTQTGHKLFHMSIGRGKGAEAKEMIDNFHTAKNWICLENCHLAGEWMPKLQHIIDYLPEMTPHPDFRLWLTLAPMLGVPTSILRVAVKMRDVPPTGVKAKLLLAYSSVSDSILDNDELSKETHLLFLGLSLFHAILQERINFGDIGWNCPYEFTHSDFHISQLQLQSLMDTKQETTNVGLWDSFHYMVSECFYGGKITDEWDRRTVRSLLTTLVSRDAAQSEGQLVTCDTPFPWTNRANTKVTWVKDLPAEPLDAPEMFRMHNSAAKLREHRSLHEVLDSLIRIQVRAASSGSADIASNNSVYEVAMTTAENIIAQLPLFMNKKPWTMVSRDFGRLPRSGDTAEASESEGEEEEEEEEPADRLDIMEMLRRRRRRASSESLAAQDRNDASPRRRRAAVASNSSDSEDDDLQAEHSNLHASLQKIDEAQDNRATTAVNMYDHACKTEVLWYMKLLDVMVSSLQRLHNAIKGVQVMGEDLEALCHSLYMGSVPELWKRNAYPGPVKLGSWMNDLCERLEFFDAWVKRGEEPAVFPLRVFSHTNSFLGGVLQAHAKILQAPVDQVRYDCNVMSELTEEKAKKPTSGCYVSGFFLQGACWENNERIIVDQEGDALESEFPPIWLNPIYRPFGKSGKEAALKVEDAQEETDVLDLLSRSASGAAAVQTPYTKSQGSEQVRMVTSSKRMCILDNGSVSRDTQGRAHEGVKAYVCPLYRTSQRSRKEWSGQLDDFVMAIVLPSREQPTRWVQRGVALLCQLA